MGLTFSKPERPNFKPGIDHFESTYGEGFWAARGSALATGAVAFIYDQYRELKDSDTNYFSGHAVGMGAYVNPNFKPSDVYDNEVDRLSVEEVQSRAATHFGDASMSYEEAESLGIDFDVFDHEMSADLVDHYARQKSKMFIRQRTLQRMPDTYKSTGVTFLGYMLGELNDPIMAAANFVPIVGEARYMSWVGKYGTFMSRTAMAISEGAMGTFLTEGFYGTMENKIGVTEYTMSDFFFNMSIGVALGNVLRHTGGTIMDQLSKHPDSSLVSLKHRAGIYNYNVLTAENQAKGLTNAGDASLRAFGVPEEDIGKIGRATEKAAKGLQDGDSIYAPIITMEEGLKILRHNVEDLLNGMTPDAELLHRVMAIDQMRKNGTIGEDEALKAIDALFKKKFDTETDYALRDYGKKDKALEQNDTPVDVEDYYTDPNIVGAPEFHPLNSVDAETRALIEANAKELVEESDALTELEAALVDKPGVDGKPEVESPINKGVKAGLDCANNTNNLDNTPDPNNQRKKSVVLGDEEVPTTPPVVPERVANATEESKGSMTEEEFNASTDEEQRSRGVAESNPPSEPMDVLEQAKVEAEKVSDMDDDRPDMAGEQLAEEAEQRAKGNRASRSLMDDALRGNAEGRRTPVEFSTTDSPLDVDSTPESLDDYLTIEQLEAESELFVVPEGQEGLTPDDAEPIIATVTNDIRGEAEVTASDVSGVLSPQEVFSGVPKNHPKMEAYASGVDYISNATNSRIREGAALTELRNNGAAIAEEGMSAPKESAAGISTQIQAFESDLKTTQETYDLLKFTQDKRNKNYRDLLVSHNKRMKSDPSDEAGSLEKSAGIGALKNDIDTAETAIKDTFSKIGKLKAKIGGRKKDYNAELGLVDLGTRFEPAKEAVRKHSKIFTEVERLKSLYGKDGSNLTPRKKKAVESQLAKQEELLAKADKNARKAADIFNASTTAGTRGAKADVEKSAIKAEKAQKKAEEWDGKKMLSSGEGGKKFTKRQDDTHAKWTSEYAEAVKEWETAKDDAKRMEDRLNSSIQAAWGNVDTHSRAFVDSEFLRFANSMEHDISTSPGQGMRLNSGTSTSYSAKVERGQARMLANLEFHGLDARDLSPGQMHYMSLVEQSAEDHVHEVTRGFDEVDEFRRELGIMSIKKSDEASLKITIDREKKAMNALLKDSRTTKINKSEESSDTQAHNAEVESLREDNAYERDQDGN